jgi:hypothetical protein
VECLDRLESRVTSGCVVQIPELELDDREELDSGMMFSGKIICGESYIAIDKYTKYLLDLVQELSHISAAKETRHRHVTVRQSTIVC